MRSILAGIAAGLVVSAIVVALVILSLPTGPVLRATPTLPTPTLPVVPSVEPTARPTGTDLPQASGPAGGSSTPGASPGSR